MVSPENIDIVTELEEFLRELTIYHDLQRRRMKNEQLDKEELRLVAHLRTTLLRKSGKLKAVITNEDRKENMRTFWIGGKESLQDIWNTGLKYDFDWLASEALDYCKDATDVAIGKLEDDIKKGIIDKQGNVIKIEKITPSSTEPPKAFIAHGGDSPALRNLKNFLEALGVQPLIVEEQPSEGRSIAENVDWYARQADCAIILATKGDIDGKTGRFIPRGNVLIEIGKSQELFKDRIIYLVQAGTKFPTNISEKVRGRFTTQRMDDAFIKIAKELNKFGILKAVKPRKEQKS